MQLTGWPRLFDTLNDLWTPDVKANQLADVISGVAPIRSIVNVGSGVADLVLQRRRARAAAKGPERTPGRHRPERVAAAARHTGAVGHIPGSSDGQGDGQGDGRVPAPVPVGAGASSPREDRVATT